LARRKQPKKYYTSGKLKGTITAGYRIAKRASDAQKAQAKKISRFIPSYKRIANKKDLLSSGEISAITKAGKALRFAEGLRPLTKKEARKFKGKLFEFTPLTKSGKPYKRPIRAQAIQLRGISPDADVKPIGKDLHVTSNGRRWLLWNIDNPRDKRAMKSAAAKAFAKQFPIERVAELAKVAFQKLKVIRIHLWAASGIVGKAFHDLEAFIDWVDTHWSAGRYVTDKGYASDPEKWINGIAILIEE
jgi:hypothetical protein